MKSPTSALCVFAISPINDVTIGIAVVKFTMTFQIGESAMAECSADPRKFQKRPSIRTSCLEQSTNKVDSFSARGFRNDVDFFLPPRSRSKIDAADLLARRIT